MKNPTKEQEEKAFPGIREGIRRIASEWFAPDGLASQTIPNDRTFEGDIFSYLKSQNVVREKNDQSIPMIPYDHKSKTYRAIREYEMDLFKANFRAVEPLE